MAERRKGKVTGGGVSEETADLKIAISALFIASLPPSHGRAILAMALSIDSPVDRRDLSSSRAPFGTSYYLVIMLRVGFLFPWRTKDRVRVEEEEEEESTERKPPPCARASEGCL